MRRLILLLLAGCAGLFAAVALTGPAHGDLLPTLTLPDTPPHRRGSAASAVAASTAAASPAASASAAAASPPPPPPPPPLRCFLQRLRALPPAPPLPGRRLPPAPPRRPRHPGFRARHWQRAPHRGSEALGTCSQRPRHEDALLHARPGGAARHGDQLPAQERQARCCWSCVPPPARVRSSAGSGSAGVKGLNRVRFNGRVHGRPLAPGRYLIDVVVVRGKSPKRVGRVAVEIVRPGRHLTKAQRAAPVGVACATPTSSPSLPAAAVDHAGCRRERRRAKRRSLEGRQSIPRQRARRDLQAAEAPRPAGSGDGDGGGLAWLGLGVYLAPRSARSWRCCST